MGRDEGARCGRVIFLCPLQSSAELMVCKHATYEVVDGARKWEYLWCSEDQDPIAAAWRHKILGLVYDLDNGNESNGLAMNIEICETFSTHRRLQQCFLGFACIESCIMAAVGHTTYGQPSCGNLPSGCLESRCHESHEMSCRLPGHRHGTPTSKLALARLPKQKQCSRMRLRPRRISVDSTDAAASCARQSSLLMTPRCKGKNRCPLLHLTS